MTGGALPPPHLPIDPIYTSEGVVRAHYLSSNVLLLTLWHTMPCWRCMLMRISSQLRWQAAHRGWAFRARGIGPGYPDQMTVVFVKWCCEGAPPILGMLQEAQPSSSRFATCLASWEDTAQICSNKQAQPKRPSRLHTSTSKICQPAIMARGRSVVLVVATLLLAIAGSGKNFRG